MEIYGDFLADKRLLKKLAAAHLGHLVDSE